MLFAYTAVIRLKRATITMVILVTSMTSLSLAPLRMKILYRSLPKIDPAPKRSLSAELIVALMMPANRIPVTTAGMVATANAGRAYRELFLSASTTP